MAAHQLASAQGQRRERAPTIDRIRPPLAKNVA